MDGSQLITLVALSLMALSILLVACIWFFAPAFPPEPARPEHLPDALAQATAPATPSAPAAGRAPVPAAVPSAAPAPAPAAAPSRSWLARLSDGLSRTRGQLVRSLDDLFVSKGAKATREETLERLFEILIEADVGVATSEALVASVRERMQTSEAADPQALRAHLRTCLLEVLSSARVKGGTIEAPEADCHVVMMVGVNGVGKTTTTGKLAHKARGRGLGVVVGAADTFRAAAVEQLAVWAERSGAELVRLKEGADPASVAFETVRLGRAKGARLCLVDTAGRLHNRNDLMQELSKIKRVMAKETPDAPHEVLLVVDATTGQNALQQARVFREIAGVTGVVLTKLDGTAKGGVALAIVSELGLPIRYVGVGETVEDLEPFDAKDFVDALFT